jgi:hypothetical protein
VVSVGHLREEMTPPEKQKGVTDVREKENKSLYAKSNQFLFARPPSLSRRAEIPQPLNCKKENACWLHPSPKTTRAVKTSIDQDGLWRRDVGSQRSPRDCGTEPGKLGCRDRWSRVSMASDPGVVPAGGCAGTALLMWCEERDVK